MFAYCIKGRIQKFRQFWQELENRNKARHETNMLSALHYYVNTKTIKIT